MITPSFGLTATERVLPKFALDFTNATLDPRVTFLRALATATRINSSGLVEAVAADTPRFDYTLNTGGLCKGLLVEEARTNLCLQSQDLTTTWLNNLPGCVTANAAVSPDGTQNADQIVLTGGGFQYVYQDVTVVVGQQYTFSFFVKAATVGNTPFRAYPDYTGVAATNVTPTQSWARQTITFTAVDTTARLAFAVPSSGAAVSIYVWGVQLELGAFATSYIPTEATALTRNADVATMTGTNFSDWYNATEGSVVAEFTPQAAISAASTAQLLYEIGNGSSGDRFRAFRNNDDGKMFLSNNAAGSANVSAIGGVVSATGVRIKTAAAYKLDNFGIATSGNAAATDTSAAVCTADQMRIGRGFNNANYLNGILAKLFYYPQRLINAEIQAFSK